MSIQVFQPTNHDFTINFSILALIKDTAKNAVIFPNLLVWKLCENCVFPQKIPHQEIRWNGGFFAVRLEKSSD